MSAPAALAFSRLRCRASRHAHQVAIGAQRHAGPLGERDRHVDAADRQHADRAARAVDHAHIGGQQVVDAVARDGMGVAAAELHEAVAGLRPDLGGDLRGEGFGDAAVAVFVDIFHGMASSTSGTPTPPPSRISASVRSASSGSMRASA